MAFLRFNENNMVLDLVVDAKENYQPTVKNIDLLNQVENLRAKMEDWKEKEKVFLTTEISPALEKIRNEVLVINEETYPELKTRRESRGN